MLGSVFAWISILSFVFAALTGHLPETAGALLDGAAGAVTLTLSLVGIMGLWNGVMCVLRDVGACRLLERLISPLLRVLFPESYRRNVALEEIAANIGANLLGLGNAATPIGIRAMQALDAANGESDTASDDMVLFVVMNTCAASFLPTTLIALRRAGGAAHPFDILVPVWISSLLSSAAAILFTKALCRFFPARNARVRAKA